MKILLLGKDGQVGWELQRSLAPLGELVALGRTGGPGGLIGDLAKPAELAQTVRTVAPDVIVNAAAYTGVDRAETEVALAHTVNADAPGVLAKEAERLGAWLVHYSTDYVFDGSGSQPWREDDATGPLGVYAQSKLAGEAAVVAGCHRHLIFRTSWVYAARGANFAHTMLRLAAERESLRVIDDQFGAPTGADLIADVTAHAVRMAGERPELAGLYHLAAAGETSWHAYAKFIVGEARVLGAALRVAPEAIEAIPASAYSLPAPRPANSRLNTDKLRNAFGLVLPRWQTGVTRMLAETLGGDVVKGASR